MLMKVFGIYDSKTEAFLPPFFVRTNGDAIRAISTHVNDEKHNFCKYAEDFTLFELGSWDDSNGKFDLLSTPHSLGLLLEFKRVDVVNS